MQEFQIPWEVCARCPQGKCIVVSEGPTISEGFSKCHGLIIRDLATEEVLITHVEPLTARRETYFKMRDWLHNRDGDDLAVLQVVGDEGVKFTTYGDIPTLVEQADPCSWEVYRAPSKAYHWGFVYAVDERILTVNTKQPNEITILRWEPNCLLPPPERISVENWDQRFVIPCKGVEPPGVVFDSWQGAGAGSLTREIRYHGFVALMRPQMFLKLARPLPQTPALIEQSTKWLEKKRNRMDLGWAPLFLVLNPSWVVPGGDVEVVNHEGRHRATFLASHCPDTLVPVLMWAPERLYSASTLDRSLLSKLREGAISEQGDYVMGPLFDTAFIEDRVEEW